MYPRPTVTRCSAEMNQTITTAATREFGLSGQHCTSAISKMPPLYRSWYLGLGIPCFQNVRPPPSILSASLIGPRRLQRVQQWILPPPPPPRLNLRGHLLIWGPCRWSPFSSSRATDCPFQQLWGDFEPLVGGSFLTLPSPRGALMLMWLQTLSSLLQLVGLYLIYIYAAIWSYVCPCHIERWHYSHGHNRLQENCGQS